MRNKIITLAMMLLLVSCEPSPDSDSGVTKTHDVTGEYIDIRVMTFDNRSSMQRYLTRNKLTNDEVDGLAQWAHPKNDLTKVKRCEIYVVEPSSVKDYNTMETWGHELVHCMYCSFHKKGER